MSARSPGPWTAEPANHSSPVDLLNPEPDHWYIDGPGADVHGFMAPADAYLIAAAPDLLEACRKAEEWLEGWASAEPYLSVIRAAIAKATKEWKP